MNWWTWVARATVYANRKPVLVVEIDVLLKRLINQVRQSHHVLCGARVSRLIEGMQLFFILLITDLEIARSKHSNANLLGMLKDEALPKSCASICSYVKKKRRKCQKLVFDTAVACKKQKSMSKKALFTMRHISIACACLNSTRKWNSANLQQQRV